MKNSNNKKLGMGLSSLVGNKKDIITQDASKKFVGMGIKSNIHYIPLDMIIPNPNQPRKYFNEKAIEGLANSIAENGIMQPILVKINKEINKYEIISGERRFLASKIAKTLTIASIVKNVEEIKSFELSIIENVQRENLSIIEEALSYDKLIKKYGYSHEEVAQKVSFSRSRVSNALRLLKLPNNIQDLINKNSISYGHARAIINADKQHEIIDLIIKKSLSVRDVEDIVKKQKEKKENGNKKNNNSLDSAFSKTLESYNLKYSLKSNNSLVIKYKDKQDLDDFIAKITLK